MAIDSTGGPGGWYLGPGWRQGPTTADLGYWRLWGPCVLGQLLSFPTLGQPWGAVLKGLSQELDPPSVPGREAYLLRSLKERKQSGLGKMD